MVGLKSLVGKGGSNHGGMAEERRDDRVLVSKYLLCPVSDPLGFASLWDLWPFCSAPPPVARTSCMWVPQLTAQDLESCSHCIPLTSWPLASLLMLRYETPLDSF